MAWFLMMIIVSVVAGTQHAHTTDSKGTVAAMALPATGAYSVRIHTSNSSCQQYFNAGLAMIYGFNRDEARGVICTGPGRKRAAACATLWGSR